MLLRATLCARRCVGVHHLAWHPVWPAPQRIDLDRRLSCLLGCQLVRSRSLVEGRRSQNVLPKDSIPISPCVGCRVVVMAGQHVGPVSLSQWRRCKVKNWWQLDVLLLNVQVLGLFCDVPL